MSVKRYVGDKFVGTDSEKSSVLADATNGASYFATDTLKIYLKEAGSWQEISGGSGGAGNIAAMQYSDGTIATNPADIAGLINEHWQRTFNEKWTSKTLRKKWLQRIKGKFACDKASL